MKERSARTSFSLPPTLLQELDEVTRTMGFGERSRALQTAIRSLVQESRASDNPEASATGTVQVIYDHTRRNIDEEITAIGHRFGPLIVSTLHVHLDDPNCLSIIVVRGKVGQVVELEQQMRKLSGITLLKVSYFMEEGKPHARPHVGHRHG